ncbi:MAG TPA: hypothetical protein PK876_05430 [Elusimicrobiota bacterium]|nr:hypothetical protein [Elusimicrobiota bacterium]
MRGTGKFLVKPKEQVRIILPALVSVALISVLGYGFLSAVRYAAIKAMEAAGAAPGLIQQLVTDSQIIGVVFMGVAAAVLFIGGLWAWRVSQTIFGPISRLENELQAVIRGEQKFLNLKTRPRDSVQRLFELFNHFLSRHNPDQN